MLNRVDRWRWNGVTLDAVGMIDRLSRGDVGMAYVESCNIHVALSARRGAEGVVDEIWQRRPCSDAFDSHGVQMVTAAKPVTGKFELVEQKTITPDGVKPTIHATLVYNDLADVLTCAFNTHANSFFLRRGEGRPTEVNITWDDKFERWVRRQ